MRTVSIVAGSAVAVGVAVHVTGVLLVNLPIAEAGGAAALLALAGYAVTATAPKARWPLVSGLVVFAIAAAAALVWDEAALRSSFAPAGCGECLRRLLAEPDLARPQWVAALALVGTVAVAVSVALDRGAVADRPRVVSAGTGVAIVVALAILEVGLFALAVAYLQMPGQPVALVGPALPALLAAAAAIGTAVYAAARDRPASVWAGLVLLSVPALIGATVVSGQAATAAVLNDANTAAPMLVSHNDDLAILVVLFAAAQLVALTMVTIGTVRRRIEPGQGMRATAP